jgi:hypothetical protein
MSSLAVLFTGAEFIRLLIRTACKKHSLSLIQYATLAGLSRHPLYVYPLVASRRSLISRQILFLNKIDLFAEKLPRSPLGDYFPDYTGGADYNAACEYLLQRFVSLNQSAATKQIYAHYTCATDTNQIRCMYFYSSRKALRSMMFISRIERNLGYPPTNPFTGVRSFVTEQRPIQSGNKSRALPLSWQDPEDTKMEMPQCPYIFNVYLLILTPTSNALFRVPTSRIPFLSSSCSIYFDTAYYPLHSRANFTLSAWIVMQALSSSQ